MKIFYAAVWLTVLGLSIADYNKCHEETEEVCTESTKRECDAPEESFDTKDECHSKYVDKCTTKYEDVCETVTKKECRTETTTKPGEPVEKCNTVMVDQCNDLPSMKCEKTQVPVVDIVPECHTEQRTVIEYVKDRECTQVQEQVCNQVPRSSAMT